MNTIYMFNNYLTDLLLLENIPIGVYVTYVTIIYGVGV